MNYDDRDNSININEHLTYICVYYILHFKRSNNDSMVIMITNYLK